ncbi:MAG: site-specific DNA-methyltransferase [Polaromonas sp.]|nr:site-specific DNA-methyltransferase [Polaromonas sp.]
MSKYNELIIKLREIFQIDRPELDFGIYRILNTRAAEINAYLENRLPEKVKAALTQGIAAQQEHIARELQEKEAQYQADGIAPDTVPKVRELREKLAQYQSGASEHENAVFSHLLAFFSRYYKDGDFISQRRYKGDTYAIPYAGEEVLLHWANKDQYYTKSGENFANYSFKLDDGRAVHFRLVAANTAKDNRKDTDKERRFAVIEHKTVTRIDEAGGEYEEELLPVEETDGANGKELILRFEYAPQPKGTKQNTLVEKTVATVLADAAVKARWLTLGNRAPTDKNPQRTLLEKHLSDYTAKNTADYFIHKDLGGFLRRELDFYIKNEVMNLDDVQNASAFSDIEKNLRMIQCLRIIAIDLIAFLAQLEDFQKKLWLKKKFVVQTSYCIRLALIPETFYPMIAANNAQREEWVQLFSINQLKPINDGLFGARNSEYSTPLTVDFLKAQPTLVVDTRHFTPNFTCDVLSVIGDLDEHSDGLLIRSDNFQALALMQAQYEERVECIYIDPPYNTGGDGFVYKDTYQHSSWQSMFNDRAALGKRLLCGQGVFLSSIDDIERDAMVALLDGNFGRDGRIGNLIWKGSTDNNPTRIAVEHEYILCYAKSKDQLNEHWSSATSQIKELMLSEFETISSKTTSITERRALFEIFAIENRETLGDLFRYRRVDARGPYAARRNMENPGKPGYKYEVLHPITKKPCTRPYWGWRFPEGTMKKFLEEERIIFGQDESKIPELKVYLTDVRFPLRSVFNLDARKGSNDLDKLFGSRDLFKNPKPTEVIRHFLPFTSSPRSIVGDYFAGSGTTGAAIINLNREDGGRRKFFLIEQGDHFDTVLLPRLKKLAYTPEWKDGKPQRLPTATEVERSPRIIKVLHLESYEDTLNNLQLRRTPAQGSLLSSLPQDATEDYLLHYMLDTEARGSLLSVEDFRKPFGYTLNVSVDSAGACELRRIDLIETFNYLIGLRVKHIDAQPERGFATVTGTLPSGESCLVLWRDCEKLDYEGIAKLCDRLAINPADNEYDVVYINGDHNIPTVLTQTAEEGGATRVLKLRQIEPEFLERMFQPEDV